MTYRDNKFGFSDKYLTNHSRGYKIDRNERSSLIIS